MDVFGGKFGGASKTHIRSFCDGTPRFSLLLESWRRNKILTSFECLLDLQSDYTLEAQAGIEPAHRGFADLRVSTSPLRREE